MDLKGLPKWMLTFVFIAPIIVICSASDPRIVCYYTNWSGYRVGYGSFSPAKIDANLCTHLIYAYGAINKESKIKPSDSWQDIDKGGYAEFTGLKATNPALKVLLSIGGTNEGSATFSHISADENRRKELVKNVIQFLRQYKFDGIDINWSRPGFGRGSRKEDKENFVKLVKELKEAFDAEANESDRLLISTVAPKEKEFIDTGFDIPSMNKYVDWMVVKTYDYASANDDELQHPTPLYSVGGNPSVDSTIMNYVKEGADKEKLLLSIPTYGLSHTISDPALTVFGSPASGPGEKGAITKIQGFLSYYEICENLIQNEAGPWTMQQAASDSSVGPFAFKGNQWVAYDDAGSVVKKAQYAAQQGLGGLMFWTLDMDDFNGNCNGKFPLIEAGKSAFNKN